MVVKAHEYKVNAEEFNDGNCLSCMYHHLQSNQTPWRSVAKGTKVRHDKDITSTLLCSTFVCARITPAFDFTGGRLLIPSPGGVCYEDW